MNKVPILFTFDQSLEMPAGVAITSLLENAAPGTFYDIFILHNSDSDFSESPLNRLPEIFHNSKMTFRKVEGEFVGSYEIRGIPETAYYRLISPEIIPEYEKILYSDVDVVIREDLSTYYNIDLEDNYFAGVDNCSRLRPDVRDYIEGSLGLDWQNGYFYSGNLVINSALLLKDGKLDDFRTLGRNEYKQVGSPDAAWKTSPQLTRVAIPEKVAVVCAYSACTAALSDKGNVWVWGSTSSGQVGNGTSPNGTLPVCGWDQGDAVEIAVGSLISAFRTKDGTVRVSGYNKFGQLGNGNQKSVNRWSANGVNVNDTN